MITNKDTAIQEIIQGFEQLSNLIFAQLDILIKIFETYTDGIPDDVFQKLEENENEIDKYEVKLDDQIINTIVLYKPVATDLRKLFAIYRMVIDLERVGDRVIKIVNFIIKIKDPESFKKSSSVLHYMLKLTSKMTNKALLSFTNNDIKGAIWTIKKDEIIDDLNHKLLKKTIKDSELPDEFQRLLISMAGISFIISSIERIGDHATNIAETSIYAFSGTNIRHKDIDIEKI